MKREISFFILLFLLFSCSNNINNDTLKIDLDLNNEFEINELFSDVEIIPLESSDNIVVDQIILKTEFYNDYIYILNPRLSTIFIFDIYGKYINKLEKGVGPEQFLSISDFNVNRFTGNLDVLTRNRIMIYDSIGETMISSKRIETPHLPTRFYNIDSQTDVLFCKYADQKLVYYDRTNNSIIDSIYEMPTYIYDSPLGFNTTPFYYYNDTVRLLQGYNGTLFSLYGNNTELIMHKYQELDFGIKQFHYSLVEPDRSVFDYVNDCRKMSYKYPLCFMSYAENYKNKFMQFWYQGTPVTLIHDKQTGENVIFNKFKGDIGFSFSYINDEFCYLLLSVDEIHSVINEKFLEKFNIELSEEFNEENNPILIKFKFIK